MKKTYNIALTQRNMLRQKEGPAMFNSLAGSIYLPKYTTFSPKKCDIFDMEKM